MTICRRSTTTGSSATSSSTGARPGAIPTRSGRRRSRSRTSRAGRSASSSGRSEAVLGLVGGWNALQLLCYCLAGLAACAWLRELGLPRGSALAGGLAFAIAPYRVEQSVGHLLGPISMLLPLSLWAFERARKGSRWWLALAGAALASIPLSGQVHLALGAIPFFVAYALCRTRDRRLWLGAAAGALAAVGAGLVVRQTVIARSTQSGGRSLDEITFYSARVGDFFSRHVDHSRSEQFVFLGWVTPLVALAGLVLLLRTRRFRLAAILGAGALVPLVLALGTRTPVYSALWHALPPFRFPRVPERLLPIASLCIAALFAYAVAQTKTGDRRSARHRAAALRSARSRLRQLQAGRSGRRDAVSGRTLARAARLRSRSALRQRVPLVRHRRAARTSQRLLDHRAAAGEGRRRPVAAAQLRRLVRRHGRRARSARCRFDRAASRPLRAQPRRAEHAVGSQRAGCSSTTGSVQRTAGPVWLFERGGVGIAPKRIEPDRSRPVFCQGWFASTASGRYMSETHAPFWIYGKGRLELDLAPSATDSAGHGGRTAGREAPQRRLASRHRGRAVADHRRGSETQGRREAPEGGYIPIA